MLFSKNRLIFNSVYKLKVIYLSLLAINISGCNELSSDEIYARESQARSSIYNMDEAQKDFLVGKNRFAKTFDELKLNTDSEKNSKLISESEHYIFKIIPQPSSTQSVMHFAQAKNSFFTNANFGSYIGVVYLVGDSDNGIIMTFRCKTSENLSVPPKKPKLAQKYDDIECPSGFESAGKSSEGIEYRKLNK
ncbi:MAG: type IV pilin-like G/H family protein [Cyanobacteriota bacterium]|nr:type IV pilin-like G/H family protein [Cyanobacteriota bacterium]